MRGRFYEAPAGVSPDHSVYRELILTPAELTSEAVRFCRSPSWALMPFRAGKAPADNREFEEDEGCVTIRMVLEAGASSGIRRYDRVVILQAGSQDEVGTTVEFFRTWFPWMIEERRLFMASISHAGRDVRREETELAIKSARPVH